MKKIEHNNEIYAVFHKSREWKDGLDFLTEDNDYIQVGTWWYNSGKNLNPHKHKENKREVLLTQEAVIVMKGKIMVILFGNDNTVIHEEMLECGDIGVMLKGGHGYKILEDYTKVIEVKSGQFISVEKDKELI